MSLLDVIKMGNPRLREVCSQISSLAINTPEFQKFVDDLIETQRAEDGAGIAASQVDVPFRVFTMEMNENPRYPNKKSFPLLIAINPEIEPISNTKIESWEGCLSIPGIRGQLPRYKQIRLNALDRNGKPYAIELDGFAAIVAQHELDHLNGILLIDRMETMKTLSFQKEFEKYWM